jgi:hypothetical protein
MKHVGGGGAGKGGGAEIEDRSIFDDEWDFVSIPQFFQEIQAIMERK